MTWIYAVIGQPMWEWPKYGEEQSVMFYEAFPPFHQGGFPPSTDAELRALDEHINRHCRTTTQNLCHQHP